MVWHVTSQTLGSDNLHLQERSDCLLMHLSTAHTSPKRSRSPTVSSILLLLPQVEAMELQSLTPDMPALLMEMGVRYDPQRLADALAVRQVEIASRAVQVAAALGGCIAAVAKARRPVITPLPHAPAVPVISFCGRSPAVPAIPFCGPCAGSACDFFAILAPAALFCNHACRKGASAGMLEAPACIAALENFAYCLPCGVCRRPASAQHHVQHRVKSGKRGIRRDAREGEHQGSFCAQDYAMGQVAANERLRAQQLRDVLSDLGAAFVKIGQALSSRPDLLPQVYLEVWGGSAWCPLSTLLHWIFQSICSSFVAHACMCRRVVLPFFWLQLTGCHRACRCTIACSSSISAAA